MRLPPCSALEIKHAALVSKPKLRCTLACDLATHNFVLCSIPPGGIMIRIMQAALGTVVTNDPDQEAWLFLKATGPCAFNVLGRIIVDDTRRGAAAEPANVPPAGYRVVSRAELLRRKAAAEEEDEDAAWPTAADVVAPSAPTGRSAAAAAPVRDDDGEESIEVLLPDGDDDLEYALSEASDDSDDFIQWMQSRTDGGQAAPPAPASKKRPKPQQQKLPQPEGAKSGGRGGDAKGDSEEGGGATGGAGSSAGQSGGSRTQRRRAAMKRQRGLPCGPVVSHLGCVGLNVHAYTLVDHAVQ